ncbi:hypothetical protein [Paenibacillus campinasensis]|nr:hypothetical protein [Paenibacillus campinasensis]
MDKIIEQAVGSAYYKPPVCAKTGMNIGKQGPFSKHKGRSFKA